MSEKIKIMILHETVAESIVCDFFTFGCLIASCYIGYLLDSSALQWIAGVLFVCSIIQRGFSQYSNHYSIAGARAELDRIEAKLKT